MATCNVSSRVCPGRREFLIRASSALLSTGLPTLSLFSTALASEALAAGVESALRSFVTTTVATGNTPGVSAAVMLPGGGLVTAAAGMADPDRSIAVTPATRFMSGSTGKTYCAATVMSLAADGIVDLDAPLAPLFRDESWYGDLPNAGALTLRMLLMHTEGFAQFLDEPDFIARILWDSIRGVDAGYPPRTMLGFIAGDKALNPPGAAHHYSDLGYHLAGVTIEKVTGRTYYDLLRERVLTKLPAGDVLPATHRDIPDLAAGYARGDILAAIAGRTGRSTDDAGVLRRNPSHEYTGGGLAVTPRALASFYWALMRGSIIPRQWVDEMTRSAIVVPSAPGVEVKYGLGVYITRRERFGRYVSHSGYYPGYNSNVGYLLDHGFSAAVQVNTDHGPEIHDLWRQLASTTIDACQRESIA
jgi:D-alanyl-D-alanine carboxypeptidase